MFGGGFADLLNFAYIHFREVKLASGVRSQKTVRFVLTVLEFRVPSHVNSGGPQKLARARARARAILGQANGPGERQLRRSAAEETIAACEAGAAIGSFAQEFKPLSAIK